ncbi:hypothetical protein JTE90_011438 [Oedothorax gibbosus]|uniref:Borealin C-terminal domain-containing protein n=1 Tax=Oedothorax gibbosus TaxID=931172 RepID=A0AAV6VE02_9ARAC|nr:hypothetical protein JTE90_011438 [Oedothorax gibbosus]
MPAKRKPKRGRPKIVADPITDEKVRRLNALLGEFRTQCSTYEKYLLTTCEEQNARIRKLYEDKLALIPKHIQEMTISQVIAKHEEDRRRNTECPKNENTVRSQFERTKCTTEKKKTLKKDRKRSVSSNTSNKMLPTMNKSMANPFPRMSKALSESCLATPGGSKFGSRISTMGVTPKFDPNVPLSSKFARKPKPNEVVMSITGSPIQNCMENPTSKLTLSLGHVKVLTYDEEAKIDKEFVKKLDEPMKQMLKDVKEKLDEILKA